MTTIVPKKRGRPRTTGDSAVQVRVYSWLTPSEVRWLRDTYGTVYSGIQGLVREKTGGKFPPKTPEKSGKRG